MVRYVSGATEKKKLPGMCEACEKRIYYIISISPLLYHWDTYKMAFLLLFQVKHVKLISFFSWLIVCLAKFQLQSG